MLRARRRCWSWNTALSTSNQPPVLASIGDQFVDENNTLTFTASATDPDVPANNLTFSLDAGAPAGGEHQSDDRSVQLDAW